MALAKRIIPCLDVDNGRVVKGVNFLACAMRATPWTWPNATTTRARTELTFLDITASSDNRDTILHVIEEVASQAFIPLTVGGGVRSVADVRRLLNAGADKAGINTAAVTNPDLINEASSFFGSQAIVVAIDAKAVNPENTRWKCLPTAGARPPALMRWNGRSICRRAAPASSALPAWIETAPNRLQFGAHPRRERSAGYSGDCIGRRGQCAAFG